LPWGFGASFSAALTVGDILKEFGKGVPEPGKHFVRCVSGFPGVIFRGHMPNIRIADLDGIWREDRKSIPQTFGVRSNWQDPFQNEEQVVSGRVGLAFSDQISFEGLLRRLLQWKQTVSKGVCSALRLLSALSRSFLTLANHWRPISISPDIEGLAFFQYG